MAESILPSTQIDAIDRLEQAGSELASLRHELDHAHRLATLGTLAAGIAHEINNILTPVLAYAQLALNNPNDQKLQAKAIERTIVGVQTASQITQAMLGFAAAPIESECANVDDVLHAALDCLGRDPVKDRIVIAPDLQSDTWVRMRPLALQQVFVNLILNARTAMQKRGGTVSISAKSGNNGATVIRVADDGPGIPAEIAGRLFEPFATSGKRSGPAKREGSGLGLAICKRLVEDAEGTIDATSTPSRGTVFTIKLMTAKIARSKAG